ncbi:MAG: thiamine pyrophosphate-binding protein [Acetobacteraceae bacterium]|nr:thiamine pyrophosphate-binding protein [Acetobacteraceae bacterium]
MMHTADMLKIFAQHRGDSIVISGRGGKHWIALSDTALDLPLGDPAMGGHSGFGLGLALARPDKRVVLFDSEGDILMSLGQLPTIAEQAPANFYHFILDNEVYATTGGQPVPNAKNVDYAMMARSTGYPRAFNFSELGEFATALPTILGAPGPVLVALKVWPEVENTPINQRVRWRKRGADKVVQDLRGALGVAR